MHDARPPYLVDEINYHIIKAAGNYNNYLRKISEHEANDKKNYIHLIDNSNI